MKTSYGMDMGIKIEMKEFRVICPNCHSYEFYGENEKGCDTMIAHCEETYGHYLCTSCRTNLVRMERELKGKGEIPARDIKSPNVSLSEYD